LSTNEPDGRLPTAVEANTTAARMEGCGTSGNEITPQGGSVVATRYAASPQSQFEALYGARGLV